MNDSFEDPDYVPPESEDSETSDTSEEGDSASVTCSYRNRQKATAENHYRQKSTSKKQDQFILMIQIVSQTA